MDLIAICHEFDLREVRERLDKLQQEHDPRLARELAEATLELQHRLGSLIRLLIAKGVITAEEYATQISESRPQRGKPT